MYSSFIHKHSCVFYVKRVITGPLYFRSYIIRKQHLYFGYPQNTSVWHGCHARNVNFFRCNFLFQWLCLHFTLTNNSCQMLLCIKKSANTFIAVVHLTIMFFSNYLHLVVVFTAAYLLALLSTHCYWHISQIIITLKGELLLSKCNCILAGSYPLSLPFPFDHNGVNMGGWDLCSTRWQQQPHLNLRRFFLKPEH